MYAFSPFWMIPSIIAKIWWSINFVILIALHVMPTSWMLELLKLSLLSSRWQHRDVTFTPQIYAHVDFEQLDHSWHVTKYFTGCLRSSSQRWQVTHTSSSGVAGSRNLTDLMLGVDISVHNDEDYSPPTIISHRTSLLWLWSCGTEIMFLL